MQAIQVRCLAPTDTLGTRYRATAAAGSVTIQKDYSLDYEAQHLQAARALCARFGWNYKLVGGQLNDGSYVFCMLTGV